MGQRPQTASDQTPEPTRVLVYWTALRYRRTEVSKLGRATGRASRLLISCLYACILLVTTAAEAASARDQAYAPSLRPAGARAAPTWLGAWMAAPQVTSPPNETDYYPVPPLLEHFRAQTLRETARLYVGGSTVRVRVSNLFGTRPLNVARADVALRSSGAAIVAGTDRPLRFGGSASTVIPPGTRAYSDPVQLTVRPGNDVELSLYVLEGGPPTSWHADARATVYISTPGDHAGETGGAAFTGRIASFVWVDGVEVAAPADTAAVVTLGNSITDGFHSARDANHRWPDFLSRRLAAQAGNTISVLNAGLSGNRVLNGSPCYGESALDRFDRDVSAQAGVRYLILQEGINDIEFSEIASTDPVCTAPATDVSAAEIVAGYQQIIARAHQRGIKVFGGTLTPAGVSGRQEAKRLAVNAWIRGSGAFDGVVDFDKLLRDPDRPSCMLRQYDSGDHLHPNDAGYQAMANLVPLAWFR